MSDEIYKSLFLNASSVMLIIHPETGRIIDANETACRYYGYKKQALLALHIHDINTLSKEAVFEEMQNAKIEKRNHFNFKHRLADGGIWQIHPIIRRRVGHGLSKNKVCRCVCTG